MPSLPGDNPVGPAVPGTALLVLRLEPATASLDTHGPGAPGAGKLGIGFGTLLPSGQTCIQTSFKSKSVLLLSVEFPQSGETRTCTVCLRDGHEAEALLAFSLEVLAPFEFSGIAYAPLSSLAASVARLATPAAGTSFDAPGRPAGRLGSPVAGLGSPAAGLGSPVGRLGSPAGRLGSPAGRLGSPAGRLGSPAAGSGGSDAWSVRSNDGLMALWAAMETDLYRFAKDPGLTAAVDGAAREQPGEYRRFARLNELYRDLVKMLLPYGLAPRRWTAWLRGQDYRPVLPWSLAQRLEGALVRHARQPQAILSALSGVLLRHGALVMMEQD